MKASTLATCALSTVLLLHVALASAGAGNEHQEKEGDKAKATSEDVPASPARAREQAISEKLSKLFEQDMAAVSQAFMEEMKRQRTQRFPFPRRPTTQTNMLRARRNTQGKEDLNLDSPVQPLATKKNELNTLLDQLMDLDEQASDDTPVAMETETPTEDEETADVELDGLVVVEMVEDEGEKDVLMEEDINEEEVVEVVPLDESEVIVEELIFVEQEIDHTLNMSELHVFVTFNDLSWADYARELLLAGLPSAVRLVNPPTDGAGNLQVYSNGQWSDVCSRYFSYREADVICRELGYEFGGKRYKSVPAVSPGMVQWVQCYGDETGLGECAVGGIGSVCSDSDQNTVQLYCNTEVFISHFSLCLTWKILLGVFLVGFILLAGLHLHAESRRKAKRDLEKSKSVQQQFVEPTFVVIPQQKGHVGVFIPPKQ